MRAIASTLAALLCVTGPAGASTPDAWQDLFDRAGKHCAAASGLRDAAALAAPVDFSDSVLVLVGGTRLQPHMRQAPAHLLCRYAKADGKVEVMELPAGWRVQLR